MKSCLGSLGYRPPQRLLDSAGPAGEDTEVKPDSCISSVLRGSLPRETVTGGGTTLECVLHGFQTPVHHPRPWPPISIFFLLSSPSEVSLPDLLLLNPEAPTPMPDG